MSTPPGNFLKQVRMQLQLGFRDVEQLSSKIAASEHEDRFYLSASRLAQIENDGEMPSHHKIFTLSVIYGLSFYEILSMYGVDPDRAHRYRDQLKLAATRPVSAELRNLDEKVTIPVRLDPSFKWEKTQLINRAVAVWGEIPAAFLLECNPRRHMYAYIGLEDNTMFPLLRPGSLVMVDDKRRDVASGGWSNEYERPIYLVETHEGYLCGWCSVDGSEITVVPHPISSAPVRKFSLSTEAEVIGQVVSVAMRLIPSAPANPGRGTTLPARF
jgi:transcriptional regulator with XRE-family HTH domain